MRALRCLPPPSLILQRPQRRTFLPNPFASDSSPQIQNLSASRTLPYTRASIYAIIADVTSYADFLPYCTSSTVTRWSAEDKDGKKWPSEARLTVGWSGIEETFFSRIYCVPERVVESVGGATETSLDEKEIQHHLTGDGGSLPDSKILTHLKSKWTLNHVTTLGHDETHVELSLSVAFANPLYSAMSSAVTPKLAGVMIEAFEKRVEALLGKHSVE